MARKREAQSSEAIRMEDCFLPQYDFARWDSKSERRNVMVAATPRSGSTYICFEFWKSGRLGAPLEYTNNRLNKYFEKSVSEKGFSRYWKEISESRTSPNGVFSFKMFTWYLTNIIDRFGSDISSILFRDVIFLYRKDIIAQAISNTIAVQTEKWFSIYNAKCTPIYDYRAILQSLQSIKMQNKTWDNLFLEKEIKPSIIAYEDFILDEDKSIKNVLKNINAPELQHLETSRLHIPQLPKLEIQANYVNEIWKERFRSDVIKLCGEEALEKLIRSDGPETRIWPVV